MQKSEEYFDNTLKESLNDFSPQDSPKVIIDDLFNELPGKITNMIVFNIKFPKTFKDSTVERLKELTPEVFLESNTQRNKQPALYVTKPMKLCNTTPVKKSKFVIFLNEILE